MKLTKQYLKKIINEAVDEHQFWEKERSSNSPKYKKFSEIVKANPKAEFFIYTSKKDNSKKKIKLVWAFNELKKMDPKRRNFVMNIPVDIYKDMKDLTPSKTLKRVGLSTGGSSSIYGIEDREARMKKREELQNKLNSIKDIVTKYGSGNYTYLNTKDNRNYKARLFVSSGGSLCIFRRGSSRYGYPLSATDEFIEFSKNVQPHKEKLSSPAEKAYIHIEKLKKLWTTKVHPNLWKKEVAIWKTVDLNEVKQKCQELAGNHYEIWKWFHQKYNTGCELIYKTTTVDSWKSDYSSQYRTYKEKIKQHLARKETFYYSWNSRYDVSVSANNNGGEYRAWFSLEYKGTGNGHYYLLVNDNLAVFAEDD